MLTILVRVKILTDALASVASVWIRPCHVPCRGSTTTSLVGEVQPTSLLGEVQPTSLVVEVQPMSLAGEVQPTSLAGEVQPTSLVGEVQPTSQRYRRYCPCPLFCSPITQPYCPILFCKTQNDFEGELCLCLLIPSPLAKCPQLTIKLYRYTV
jgi:hypothetical protein